jgi:hypothetical protein
MNVEIAYSTKKFPRRIVKALILPAGGGSPRVLFWVGVPKNLVLSPVGYSHNWRISEFSRISDFVHSGQKLLSSQFLLRNVNKRSVEIIA